MAFIERREDDSCEIEIERINGKRFFRCRNKKRPPTADEILEEVSKNSKIIYKK